MGAKHVRNFNLIVQSNLNEHLTCERYLEDVKGLRGRAFKVREVRADFEEHPLLSNENRQ